MSIMAPMKNSLPDEIETAGFRMGIRERKLLATILDVSQTHMSDLLNGKRAFTVDMVNTAIRELNVPKQTARRWHRIGAKAAGWDI